MRMRSLGDVARALYGATPAEFLEARGAEARAALDNGDRVLAQRIRDLRKPTVAAWAVNALVRERPHEVDALLHLGERMRAASAALDRDALQSLGRERQRLLAGLARSAHEVGDEAGVAVSEAAAIAVQTTFQAAVSDPSAAAAVRSGLLVRTLSADGVAPAELAGSMAIAVAAVRPSAAAAGDEAGAEGHAEAGSTGATRAKTPATATATATSARARAADRERERVRAREVALREADQAQQQADDAVAALAELESRIRHNHAEHERLTDELRRLRRELDALQDAATETKTAGAALRRDRQAAVRASEAARRAATRARQASDRL